MKRPSFVEVERLTVIKAVRSYMATMKVEAGVIVDDDLTIAFGSPKNIIRVLNVPTSRVGDMGKLAYEIDGLGCTQKEFAKRCGVTASTVHQKLNKSWAYLLRGEKLGLTQDQIHQMVQRRISRNVGFSDAQLAKLGFKQDDFTPYSYD